MKQKTVRLIIMLLIIVMFVLLLTACNKQIVDLNWKFDYAYVKIGEDWHTVKIKKWADFEGEQLQLILEDDTVMVVNSINCILYKGTLPTED